MFGQKISAVEQNSKSSPPLGLRLKGEDIFACSRNTNALLPFELIRRNSIAHILRLLAIESKRGRLSMKSEFAMKTNILQLETWVFSIRRNSIAHQYTFSAFWLSFLYCKRGRLSMKLEFAMKTNILQLETRVFSIVAHQ